MKNKKCVFTIVANNYLHYANSLFESVAEQASDVDLILALCDKRTEHTICPKGRIIELSELPIKDLGQFIYQYSILELNTAIKPYVIELLMDKGYEEIIYFDPDIYLFNSLDEMFGLLKMHNVLLTPHLTNITSDDKEPSELSILKAGTYNLGFIALSANPVTRKLVKWWQKKLYKDCVVDPSRGLFVDQKWMDLAPAIFDGVFVNRNEGWNVAYWNLSHRDISKGREGGFYVNGVPLVFFHFSGFSIETSTLSKHQNRFSKKSKGPELLELCEFYSERLIDNGIREYSKIKYVFNYFADGTKVPDAARLLIRTDPYFEKIDFFDSGSVERILAYLNENYGGNKSKHVRVTRLAAALWFMRKDIRSAFPQPFSRDAIRYVEWLLAAAEKECGFSDILLEPMYDSLMRYRSGLAKANSSLNEAVGAGTKEGLVRFMFKCAWNKRDVLPLSIRLALGERFSDWAFSKAYGPPAIDENETPLEAGVNLIGYVNSESGVGEAARSSIRAMQSASIPFRVIDYRVGNVSRMNEVIEVKKSSSDFAINLIHVNADQSKIVRDSLGAELFNSKYNIGFWYWELPEFPGFLDFAFEQVDEIWVATRFVYDAIILKTNKPVFIIPPNVSQVTSKSNKFPSSTSIREKDFVFLHTSDALSIPERKNPIGVAQAFIRAFGKIPDLPVKLVIKISNIEKQGKLKQEIEKLVGMDERVIVLLDYLDRAELNGLYSRADCYVSLHRSEGFGLPIAESMSAGKPVIATNWSGNVDFMNEENSLPIAYKLVEIAETIGPYEKGQIWADPDMQDAADKMELIYTDRTLREKISENAIRTIETSFSPKATGEKIRKRISELVNSI